MMNTASGRHMAYKQHIHQSIENILFTRLGTRVQREEYGSLLPDLIDMPLTPNIAMLCYAATVEAIARWEPRVLVRSVNIEAAEAARGRLKITVGLIIKAGGSTQTLSIYR